MSKRFQHQPAGRLPQGKARAVAGRTEVLKRLLLQDEGGSNAGGSALALAMRGWRILVGR
jgi:hypothetical protein